MLPLDDPIEEARRILQVSEQKRIALRLFGGVAFYFQCPSASQLGLSRRYADIDFMGHNKQSKEIKELFEELGYVPRERFNAMQGYRRLIFNDIQHQRRVDIFLDVFEMCHKFNFKDRIELESRTIPLADLLATKLQIVEITEKDLKDIMSMFLDHVISSSDSGAIDGIYLARLAGDDWGIYKTFTMNLDKVLTSVRNQGLDDHKKQIISLRAAQLKKMMEDAQKTFRWKMRAKVGEKMQWYELPEADKGVIDSRITA
jgi:hypothetical protein